MMGVMASRAVLAVMLAPMPLASGTASARELTPVEAIQTQADPITVRELDDRADAAAIARQQDEDTEQVAENAPLGPIRSPTPEAQAVALELARLTHTDDVIIGAGSTHERTAFLEIAAADEELAATERKHLGFLAAFWAEAGPVLDRSARERLPELHELQAATYAAHLTAGDLRWARCLITALGAAGIKTIADAAVIENSIASLKKSRDLIVEDAALRRDLDASRAAGADALSKDGAGKALMAACPRTTPPPDTRELSYRLNSNVLQWGSGETEWEAAEIDKAMERALARVGAK